MAPVAALIVRPAGAEYTPPVYAPVPAKVTACATAREEQNGVPA